MARVRMWQGRLLPIPKYAAYRDGTSVVAAMTKRYGPNDDFPPPGWGRALMIRRRHKFADFDAKPSLFGKLKYLKVYATDGKTHGRCNGVANQPCARKGCGGKRLTVFWPDGHMTFPCSTTLSEFIDGAKSNLPHGHQQPGTEPITFVDEEALTGKLPS